MEKLTSKHAFELLIEDVINSDSDYQKKENRWIWHCIYVGKGAKRIAAALGLDADYAEALGYIHDIGRKIRHQTHPTEGYYYMKERGFEKEAGICLTHSFIDNDISLTAGEGPSGEVYEFLNSYLHQNSPSIYDNIIQLCDLFCLSDGFTTIERRLLDVTERKGITDNSQKHYEGVKELQKRIEEKLGCSLYELFPEISESDLENISNDREQLFSLFLENSKIKKHIEEGNKK